MRYPGNEPCPRPGEMVLVKTRKGKYWRNKRSRAGNKAAMNKGMKAGADMVKKLMPAAARFVSELRPYMLHMEPERIVLRVKNRLHRSVKEKGELDYSYMDGFEFQPDQPIWQLMQTIRGLTTDGNDVAMYIPIPKGGAVKALNTFITGYSFRLIMIVGDPIRDKLLRSYEVSSPRYRTGQGVEEGCDLRMIRPDKGEKWICILQIISYEGKSLPMAGRHYGMKVVGWDSEQMHEYESERRALEKGTELLNVLKYGSPGGMDDGAEGTIVNVEGTIDNIEHEKGSVEGTIDNVKSEVEGTIEGRIGGISDDTGKKLAAILTILKNKGGIRANTISGITGFSLKSTERYIKILRDAGLIQFKGAKSTGGYFLSG